MHEFNKKAAWVAFDHDQVFGIYSTRCLASAGMRRHYLEHRGFDGIVVDADEEDHDLNKFDKELKKFSEGSGDNFRYHGDAYVIDLYLLDFDVW